MIDHKYPAFCRGQDVDVVGTEPGGRHDHKFFSSIQHVGCHALRGTHPESARAMKRLLHFVRVAVVNDDDFSATFGKHLMSVGMIHGSPKNNSRLHGHASTPQMALGGRPLSTTRHFE